MNWSSQRGKKKSYLYKQSKNLSDPLETFVVIENWIIAGLEPNYVALFLDLLLIHCLSLGSP